MSAYPPPSLEGEGTHTLAVGDEHGLVFLIFERPVRWVSLDPESARQVAEKIARTSYKARFGDDPTPERRSHISDTKIAALRIRLRNILKAKFVGAEEAQFAVVANACLDAVLTEIA